MRGKLAIYLFVMTVSFGCGGDKNEISAGTMPQGGAYTGVYHSPQYGEMHLMQTGDSVVGEYKKDERSGRINGSVEGDLMRFEWVEEKAMISNRPTETRGRGYFRYLIDPSTGDHVLKGEWGIEDEETGGGPWNAWKSKHSQPKLSSDSGESSGGETAPDEGTTADEFGGESSDTGEAADDLL
ncbi:MAG: hypothetical protein JXA30_00155 [Deltaproteobacteria bacterium]|nr:hypothetical protein [Deltaproteobacteria bacterium]